MTRKANRLTDYAVVVAVLAGLALVCAVGTTVVAAFL